MTSQPIASVLVVDDDPILCAVARTCFQKFGASDISVAHNGLDALEIVDQNGGPFDFILLDLKMPVMDGVQFLRHMDKRAYEGLIGIVSGEGPAILSLAMDLARKCGLNVVGSIAKPLNMTRLEELVSKQVVLQRRAGQKVDEPLTADELEAALNSNQIVAHYQPQVAVASGILCGVEALARWQHPERGTIPPDMFVPLAEDSGLMALLTDRMIERVISDSAKLNNIGYRSTISINLGASVLQDTAFPDKVGAIIERSGLEKSRFIFELTESKLVEDSLDSMEVLARMDLAGFQLSLDDFGTQFSNMEQLSKFPFKELKIDRGFVRSAATDERSRATVESCVWLGKKFGLRIVAEGVETTMDWQFLESLGVDILQGFRIAKPMAVDDLLQWAETYNAARDRTKVAANA